jgi:hypothetical protein
MITKMTLYKHTQSGSFIKVILWGTFVLFLIVFSFAAEGRPYTWPAFLMLLGIAMLFNSLTIEVTESRLSWKFGVGVIRKSVPISDIETLEVVRNRWWYGYGIRYTPHGWLYNVSGLKAIEVKLKDGKTFRLGTDEPEELHRALSGLLT